MLRLLSLIILPFPCYVFHMSVSPDHGVTPAISLILPGLYHVSRGRVREALCWAILVTALIPTGIGALISVFCCYRSAVRISHS